ncbi:MAG: hypothetical protein K1X83_00930 [Oligoflexia bacterium]|nr:hypothetical protein [Oligoflexia bacterium]
MRTFLVLVALCCCWGSSRVSAQTLQYEILGYGTKHVVLMLRGSVPLGLNSSMSSDGLAARVSAVGVQFAPRSSAALPALVSSVQQVKRGPTTDLVVNLNEACELSVSPATGGVKLVIKSRKGSTSTQSPETTALPASTTTPLNFPFRVISGNGNQKRDGGLTIALPEPGKLNLTAVGAALRACAYSIDLFCSILGCGTLSIPRNPNLESPGVENAQDSSAGDQLIASLSTELEQLRQELAAKNRELEALKEKTP